MDSCRAAQNSAAAGSCSRHGFSGFAAHPEPGRHHSTTVRHCSRAPTPVFLATHYQPRGRRPAAATTAGFGDRVVAVGSRGQHPLLARSPIAGILHHPGRATARGVIETKAVRQVANLPAPASQAGERPTLTQVAKAMRLLNDVATWSDRVADQVRLEPAELIEEVVDLAIYRRDIRQLWRRIRL